MKPAPFTYHAPSTLDEIVGLLGQSDNARLLAGGQSLMPMLNMRYVQPDLVIDINRVPGLAGIVLAGDVLEIGAMTRQHEVLTSHLVRTHVPLLAEALSNVGHLQTRNRGTVGGSLCHLDPAAEIPSATLALGATLVATGPDGDREIPIEDWFLGYMTPNLAPTELLRLIRYPIPAPKPVYGFLEFARRKGDFALASVACLLNFDEGERVSGATIVVAGLDTRPVRCTGAEDALRGAPLSDASIEAAAGTFATLEVLGDAYADGPYRIRLAQALLKRAITRATARAREATDA